MKIILSRKGFDSTAGGIASPIIPDGRLLSLPIPVTPEQAARGEEGIAYEELRFGKQSLSEIIQQLRFRCRRLFPYEKAHLDPDLDPDRFASRECGWKRTFGQTDRPQGHLRNQHVGVGDLFLFFGWFKQAELRNDVCRYVRDAGNLHVIFGWLQIGEVLTVGQNEIPNRLHYHPHFVNANSYGDDNTIYVACEKLNLNGKDSAIAGAGIFSQFNKALCLTAPDEHRRTHWRLPRWFYPFGNPARPPLTYHENPRRWTLDGDHVLLRSASPGQEFVFDTERYPEAGNWLEGLFEAHA